MKTLTEEETARIAGGSRLDPHAWKEAAIPGHGFSPAGFRKSRTLEDDLVARYGSDWETNGELLNDLLG